MTHFTNSASNKQLKSRESEIAQLSTEAETREIEINDLTGSGKQPLG